MSRVPRIRFKGFEEDWEQRKLSDLYEKVIEKNDLSFGTDKIISVASMYYKEDTSNSDDDYMRTYNVMRLGDIAFEGNKSKNFAHGRFVENTIGDGIVSHVFDVFRPISEYDLLFWKYFINYEGVMGRIMIRCTKSSTMMTNLVAKDFLEESIVVPSIVEQKRIGYYLKSIDHLITLHQRKLEKLKIIKKSMLENLFPQNEEKTPKIRFLGFTKDWEQRKFSEIVLRESNFRLSSPDLPCVEYEDVVSEAGILNNDIRSKKVVKAGIVFYDTHVLYGKLRPYLHNWLCPDFSGVAVGDWWVLKPCYVVREFIYRIIQTKRFDNATNQSSGSKMPRADWNLVSNTEFMIPSDSSEQEKIGLYFKKIDHLITLHQSKLEKLQKIKKSMLESMFV